MQGTMQLYFYYNTNTCVTNVLVLGGISKLILVRLTSQ